MKKLQAWNGPITISEGQNKRGPLVHLDPDDCYISLTPAQARRLGGYLQQWAANALADKGK